MHVRRVSTKSLLSRPGLLAFPLFEGRPLSEDLRRVDRALGSRLSRILREESFTPSAGKLLVVHTQGGLRASRFLLVGMGRNATGPEPPARVFAAYAIREAMARRAGPVSLVWPFARRNTAAAAVEELALGAHLGAYRYRGFKSEAKREGLRAPDEVAIPLPDSVARAMRVAEFDALAARGLARGQAVTMARDLVNRPANHLGPAELVAEARALAAQHPGLSLEVLDREALVARGMGLLLAVAQGAGSEPALIHLRYAPEGGGTRKKVAIVGKGVTFDAGGLDIKAAPGMLDMKCDMAGGAAVLATMGLLARLAPDVEVHGLVPAVENLLGERAYRPGDVLRASNGKTVEVRNTDAEGRLAVGDAMAYAVELGVDEIIDLATLTGACVVGLGEWTAGLFSNRRALAGALGRAASAAGESLLELPLDRRMWSEMESEVADFANIGGRWGGACHGALFLEQFCGVLPWAHLDIAGPAYVGRAEGITPKGATGFGVLTLAAYLS